MSFGSAVAAECAAQQFRTFVAFVAVMLSGAVVGGVMFKYFAGESYRITRDDIELLKDAAVVLGPGDPIARGLWRLAERVEGK